MKEYKNLGGTMQKETEIRKLVNELTTKWASRPKDALKEIARNIKAHYGGTIKAYLPAIEAETTRQRAIQTTRQRAAMVIWYDRPIKIRLCNYQSAMRRKIESLIKATIPPTWGTVIKVTVDKKIKYPSLRYIQDCAWGEAGSWAQKHSVPARRWDELRLDVPIDCPVIALDTKTIKAGDWEYQKMRGHALAVRYTGNIVAAGYIIGHLAEEQELMRALLIAHPTLLSRCGVAREVQSDDYGTLYNVFGQKMVLVTCPTTADKYLLCVSQDIPTAHAAVAATFGMKKTEYKITLEV